MTIQDLSQNEAATVSGGTLQLLGGLLGGFLGLFNFGYGGGYGGGNHHGSCTPAPQPCTPRPPRPCTPPPPPTCGSCQPDNHNHG